MEIKKDLKECSGLHEEFQMGIRAIKTDFESAIRFPNDRRQDAIRKRSKHFGSFLKEMSDKISTLSESFERIGMTKAERSSESVTTSNEQMNLSNGTKPLLEKIKKKTSKIQLEKLNEKKKERWVNDVSSSDAEDELCELESEEDSATNISPNISEKSNDPNLSQINNLHTDDDDILVKNEPLNDSQKSDNESTITKGNQKSINDELSKWNDIEDGFEEDNDFHGFDEFQNEIPVKAEMSMDIDESIILMPSKVDAAVTKEVSQATEKSSEDIDINIEAIAKSDQSPVNGSEHLTETEPVINTESEKLKPMENVIDSSSDAEATDGGSIYSNLDDDDNEGKAIDKEIEKLLDFSNLGVKRKLPTTSNVNEAIITTKKVDSNFRGAKKAIGKNKHARELLEIMNQPHDNHEETEEAANPVHGEITEEDFLREQNLALRNRLLEDSSSETESDISDIEILKPKKSTKDKSIANSDDEYSTASSDESCESLVDRYLQTKSKVDKKKDCSELDHESENASLSAVGEQIIVSTKNMIDKSPSSAESNQNGEGNKSKSVIGSKLFGNLDKITNEEQSEEMTDDSEIEADSTTSVEKNLPKSKSDSRKSSNSDILDTSMFKEKRKEIDSSELSKMLNTTAKRKTPTMANVANECISLSSDEDEPVLVGSPEAKETEDEGQKTENRGGRKLLRADQLADQTKQAQKEETDRVKRLEKKQRRLAEIIKARKKKSEKDKEKSEDHEDAPEDVILDYDSKKQESIIVHRDILKHLKSHQIDGIKFMYDCCYGSVDQLDQHPGSGCILAHCMGLGKTLQLISLLHTVIRYPQLKTNKVLVICPKSTVLNWKEEIERWLSPIKGGRHLKLFQFPDPW